MQQVQPVQQQAVQTPDQPKAKRALFNVGGTNNSVSSSRSSSASVTMNGHEPSSPGSPLVFNSMSMNSLPSIGESMEKLSRKESLAHVFQEKLSSEVDEIDELDGEYQILCRKRRE